MNSIILFVGSDEITIRWQINEHCQLDPGTVGQRVRGCNESGILRVGEVNVKTYY